MRIAYIAAGAAGMYCGSCLHDNTLAGALRQLGEDCLLVPTYTPIRTDETDHSEPYVFFSGLNVALQQKFPWLRRTPFWLDRPLAAPGLLRWLGVFSGAVDPARLGPLTLSVLQGPDGRQAKELERLVIWLANVRPDVVHLSNSLLCGWAGALGSRLGRPVVCSLSGEDLFVDQLAEPWRQRVREELRARAQGVTCFVALNRYYADYMADYLAIPRAQIRTIPHGLDLAGHGRPAEPAAERPTGARLGYFARVCAEKGLPLLVEAWRRLARDPRQPPVSLHVAGYLGRRDRALLEQLQRQIADWGLAERFVYHGSPDRAGKIAFLQSLDVFALPTTYPESKGLTLLEAWANGIPAVVPEHGTFPELLADSGGGLLCRPGDADDLARQIGRLLANPLEARDLGRRGQAAVASRYHAPLMAERTRALYRELCAGPDAADDLAGLTGENLAHA